MQANEMKQLLFDLGADLCGIAAVDRLDDAPDGFHPRDLLPSCQSVIVFAKAFPAATLQCSNTVPYTIVRNTISDMLDQMAVQLCIELERCGIAAVPTGTITHTRRDENTGRSHGPVSSKHCAVAAGLGRIGKNTLLVTPEYGNMVWLHAVLTDEPFTPDTPLEGSPCPEHCSLCVEICPAHALGNPEMNQDACYDYAFYTEPGKTFVFRCHACRSQCPNCLGTRNAQMHVCGK